MISKFLTFPFCHVTCSSNFSHVIRFSPSTSLTFDCRCSGLFSDTWKALTLELLWGVPLILGLGSNVFQWCAHCICPCYSTQSCPIRPTACTVVCWCPSWQWTQPCIVVFICLAFPLSAYVCNHVRIHSYLCAYNKFSIKVIWK